MDKLFLDKSEINNFDEIIDNMLSEGICSNTICIEHIADIITHLDSDDKKRSIYDPQLKKAVFTVIRELISNSKVELVNEWSTIPELRDGTNVSHEKLFELLDEYWEIYKNNLTDRDYMLWFKKAGTQISNN
jgi:hypothetical protein